MPSKDYFAILCINKDASDEDIRKAYRKLAMKYHPDKNPDNKAEAEIKFKEIAEAYSILSDPQKKAAYLRGDMDFNSAGEGRGGGGWSSSSTTSNRGNGGFNATFVDPFDVFRHFFGGRDPFNDFDVFGDDFGMGMGPNRKSSFGRSPFDGMNSSGFFHSGFGGGDSFSSSMSSSTSSGGGRTVSTSTETKIVNGKRVTRTVKRTTLPDGTTTEEVSESTSDAPASNSSTSSMSFIQGFPGGNFSSSQSQSVSAPPPAMIQRQTFQQPQPTTASSQHDLHQRQHMMHHAQHHAHHHAQQHNRQHNAALFDSSLAQLLEMGFDAQSAAQALEACNGDVYAAAEVLSGNH